MKDPDGPDIPKQTEWPVEGIEDVARRSGKPLEVQVALAFMRGGWTVELGSHFADGSVTRELDVLVTKRQARSYRAPRRVRLLVSCKGFRPDRSPLVYSLSKSSIPAVDETIIATSNSHCAQIESEGAGELLKASSLANERPLVAFDTVRRREEGKGDKTRVLFDGGGDVDIYDGLDSALKAAFFWMQHDTDVDYVSGDSFVSIYVPILVLSIPMWDACIDGGVVARPTIRHRGHHVARYPRGRHDPLRSVLSLVWSAEQLDDLVTATEALYRWFDTISID